MVVETCSCSNIFANSDSHGLYDHHMSLMGAPLLGVSSKRVRYLRSVR